MYGFIVLNEIVGADLRVRPQTNVRPNTGHGPTHRSAPTFGARGGILVLTLWLVSFLTVLVLVLGAQILTERRVQAAYADRVYLAIASLTMQSRFRAALKQDETQEYDALKDPWSQNPELFENVPLGESHNPSASLGSGNLKGAIDEERFININKASLSLLQRLFSTAAKTEDKETQALASAVQDWRDLDVFSSHPQMDTESAVYSGSYPSKNGEFESPEELLLVYGINAEIYQALRPLITLYGDGQVNLNTAPESVLRVLGAPDSLIQKILQFRAASDGAEGTEDDGYFDDPGSIENKLQEKFGQLNTEETNALSVMRAENWIGVRSKFFRLPIQVKRGSSLHERDWVVDREGGLKQVWS